MGKNRIMKYKLIDNITSDVMFEAYGRDLRELFENSGLALFSIICDLKKIKPEIKKELILKADDVEDLLLKWLQALIAVVDTDELFLSKFKVLECDGTYLRAECFGEGISPEKGLTVVKAVSYYGFKFEKISKGYKIRIACDI